MLHARPRPARPFVLAALTALLAACGAQTPSATSGSGDRVALTLRTDLASALSGSALAPQGIPFRDDGKPAVQSVRVQVFVGFPEAGEALRFDAQGNEDPNGTRDFIELRPDASSVTVRLRPGTYFFRGIGLSSNKNGVALAVGDVPDREVGGSAPTVVNLPLKTLIGRFALVPALPLKYVLPGQVFDVNFVVQTPEVNGKRYTVPLNDFDLASAARPDSSGLTVLNSSKLGVRLQADGTGSDVRLVTEINGTVGGPNEFAYTRLFAELTLPMYAKAVLGADLARPSLSVDTLFQNGRQTLSINGRADDNVGLARLQVYEGPVLIGSTDPDEYGQAGVSKIDFLDNEAPYPNWVLYQSAPLRSGKLNITVVAQDTSGNETRVSRELNIQ